MPQSRSEAVRIILDTAMTPVAESVPLHDTYARVLLSPIHADRDHPPFNRATMDGFALRAHEMCPGTSFAVTSRMSAGASPPQHIGSGSCVAIATGAEVPGDLDAVIEHELSDRENPVRFTVNSIQPGRNIHPRGIDRVAGDILLDAPCRIGSAEIGSAASAGHSHLDVARKPRVIVISTGEELVDIDAHPGPQQLRDSNRAMIASAADQLGAAVLRTHHVGDDLQETINILATASSDCDLLITIGGVSAGERDFIPAAWEHLGATPRIQRVPVQPGRPTRLWEYQSCSALALPGNPVSALLCMHLFARPWIRSSIGLDPLGDWQTTKLAQPATPNPRRTLYRACNLKPDAHIPPWHGSGDLPHLAGTDGLVELPKQEADLDAGTTCSFLRWEA